VRGCGSAALGATYPVGWADKAAELGWSDQAHLIRDFKGHTGVTPSHYLAAQRSTYDRAEAATSAGFVPETRWISSNPSALKWALLQCGSSSIPYCLSSLLPHTLDSTRAFEAGNEYSKPLARAGRRREVGT
jgi:hypothetical protein